MATELSVAVFLNIDYLNVILVQIRQMKKMPKKMYRVESDEFYNRVVIYPGTEEELMLLLKSKASSITFELLDEKTCNRTISPIRRQFSMNELREISREEIERDVRERDKIE